MPLSLTQPADDSLDWGADVNKNFGDIETLVNAIETDLAAAEANIIANAAAIAVNAADLGAHNRGDAAADDWDEATLTADGAWHELDLSAKVPVGTSLVIFRLYAKDDIINSYMLFRKKGETNNVNVSNLRIAVANVHHTKDAFVFCDGDRKIEYFMSNVVWTSIGLTVAGSWKGG